MKASHEIIEKQFRSLDDFYLDIIRRHEVKLQADLRNYESLIAQSWKWRVGTSLVNASVKILNFLTSPLKFYKDKGYRDTWKGLSVKASPRFQFVPVLGGDALLKKPRFVLPVEEDKNTENQEVSAREMQSAIKSEETPDTMAVILDTPTTWLLSSQGHVFPLKPEGFGEQLDQAEPGFFLCESARRGNGGAWQYKLSGENGRVPEEIQQLVSECKTRSVPTFFLMNCTSSAALHFYQTAFLFDYILSADQGLAGRLPVEMKDRIHYFPFSVDPGLHHPITNGLRNTKVCFVFDSGEGTSSLHFSGVVDFLKSAIHPGLDVYDISYGESPSGQDISSLIREYNCGYLPYVRMAERYREYMALLNISPGGRRQSYIPRWIFEALASGLTVISEPSELLEKTFGDTILFADSGADVAAHLNRLMNDQLFRMKQVVKGIRAVMSSHLIEFRLGKIKSLAGMNASAIPEPKIGLMIDAGEEQGLDDLLRCIQRQTKKPEVVALFMHRQFPDATLQKISSELDGILVRSFVYYQHQLYQPVREGMACDYYMVWQRGCFYGEHYIEDYLQALHFTDVGVLCKCSWLIQEDNHWILSDPEGFYRRVTRAPVSTLMLGSEQLAGFNFLRMTDPDAFYDAFDERMVSLDPLNFFKPDTKNPGSTISLWNELNV
jgi:hypothetical protein